LRRTPSVFLGDNVVARQDSNSSCRGTVPVISNASLTVQSPLFSDVSREARYTRGTPKAEAYLSAKIWGIAQWTDCKEAWYTRGPTQSGNVTFSQSVVFRPLGCLQRHWDGPTQSN